MWASAAQLACQSSSYLICLPKFVCFLDPQQLPCVEDSERLLTTYMLQVVSILTLRSIKNTGIYVQFKTCHILKYISNSFTICNHFFVPLILVTAISCCGMLNFCICISVSVRDLGMVPYIKIFLDEDQYRGPTLSILEQLAEINPEEFMSTAIGALCSSTQQELELKRDLLQVLTCYKHPTSQTAAHTHKKHSDMQ